MLPPRSPFSSHELLPHCACRRLRPWYIRGWLRPTPWKKKKKRYHLNHTQTRPWTTSRDHYDPWTPPIRGRRHEPKALKFLTVTSQVLEHSRKGCQNLPADFVKLPDKNNFLPGIGGSGLTAYGPGLTPSTETLVGALGATLQTAPWVHFVARFTNFEERSCRLLSAARAIMLCRAVSHISAALAGEM